MRIPTRLGRLRVALICLALFSVGPAALALSRGLPSPDINFPKDYDKARAAQIVAVLSNPKLKYADGIESFWPPKWGTTLVYDGDTDALNGLLADLHGIKGLNVAVSFSRGNLSTTRDGHSGNWKVKYAQDDADTLSVVVSLRPNTIDLEKLRLPVSKGGP